MVMESSQPKSIDTTGEVGDSKSSEAPNTAIVKEEPETGDEQLRQLLERPKLSSGNSQSCTVAADSNGWRNGITAVRSTGTGQQKITSYFIRNGSEASPSPIGKNDELDDEKNPPIDLESIKGAFGWTTFGNVHVPYIFRQDQKFASVRIIEQTLLKKYLQALPPDVYSCTYIKSYYMTQNEAPLFNEINRKHCDGQFGAEDFTVKDLVVQLSDVEQLLDFLSTCYGKLVDPEQPSSAGGLDSRCGFIKLNNVVVPYIIRNGSRHVPLSFFKQEVASLQMKAEKLESWELSYLKFCCKVAGIHSDFLNGTSCLVVSLEDVIQCSNLDVCWEEWWPKTYTGFTSNKMGTNVNVKSKLLTDTITSESADAESVIPRFLPPAVPASGYYNSAGGYDARNIFNLNVNSGINMYGNHLSNANESGMGASSEDCSSAGSNSHALTSTYGTSPLSALTTTANPQQFIFSRQWWGPIGQTHGFSPPSNYPSPTLPANHCLSSVCACCPPGSPVCHTPTSTSHPPSLVFPPTVIPSPSLLKYSCTDEWGMRQEPPHSRLPNSPTQPALQAKVTHNVAHQLQSETGNLWKRMSYQKTVENGSDTMFFPEHLQQPLSQAGYGMPVSEYNTSHSDHGLSNPDNMRGNNGGNAITSSDCNYSRGSTVICAPMNSANGRGLIDISSSLPFHAVAQPSLSASSSITRKESQVVAPGVSQPSLIKQSSPKPANQVPVTIHGRLGDASTNLPGQDHASTRCGDSTRVTGVVDLSTSLRTLQKDSENGLQNRLMASRPVVGDIIPMLKIPQLSPEEYQNSSLPPYRVHKMNIDGRKIHVINMTPFQHSTMVLAMVVEVVTLIFPELPLHTCIQVMTELLNIKLYECNWAQKELIQKYIHPLLISDQPFTMVLAEDLVTSMPHLKSLLNRVDFSQYAVEEPLTKRSRTATSADR